MSLPKIMIVSADLYIIIIIYSYLQYITFSVIQVIWYLPGYRTIFKGKFCLTNSIIVEDGVRTIFSTNGSGMTGYGEIYAGAGIISTYRCYKSIQGSKLMIEPGEAIGHPVFEGLITFAETIGYGTIFCYRRFRRPKDFIRLCRIMNILVRIFNRPSLSGRFKITSRYVIQFSKAIDRK